MDVGYRQLGLGSTFGSYEEKPLVGVANPQRNRVPAQTPLSQNSDHCADSD